MTTVYVLILIVATTNSTLFTNNTTVNVETAVFKDADRCLRNLELNRKEFSKPGVTVEGFCKPSEIVPTKGVK